MDEDLNSVAPIDKQDGWITALAALQALSRSMGEQAAEERLLSLLGRGELQGRADLLLEEADIGPLFLDEEHWVSGDDWEWRRERPKRYPNQRDKTRIELSSEDEHVMVRDDFFAAADSWLIDPLQVSWPDGVIVARRLAKFPAKLNLALMKRRVVVGGTSNADLPEVHAPINEAEAFIRRAVRGLRFKERDILYFGAAQSDVSHDNLENGRAQRPDIDRSLPADCEPVMDEFRLEIASGEFAAKYKNPTALGVRAKIGRELVSKMMKRELAIPSNSTVRRKVDRLVDEFNDHQKSLRPLMTRMTFDEPR